MRRICLQNCLPSFTAVGCFVETAFAAICPQISHCRDISDLGILGIDYNARDTAAVFQSNVCPMLSRSVETAFAAICPQISHCRDISDLGILGIDYNARDTAAVFQSNVCPMLA